MKEKKYKVSEKKNMSITNDIATNDVDYEGGSDFNVKKMNVSNTDRFGIRRKIQLIAESDATLRR